MRLPAHARRLRAALLTRWDRVPGLRTAKATLAAVLSYVAADLLNTSQAPILAPVTALLVVQLTVYETVAQGIQRVFSVLAGVLVAVGIATFVGLTWWSLGAVVAVSLVIGQFLRLGPHTVEVPISAMLVLAVGAAGAGGAAVGRAYETLVGAAIGAVVNFAVAPPVYVRPAGDAIGHVAGRLAEFLRGLAGDLRGGWSRAAADRWLSRARALGPDISRADRSLARAEQSALLNPRGDEVREAQPRLRAALTGMELCYILLRTLCREIFDRTYYLPPEKETEAYGPQARAALAEVLECAAESMCAVAEVAAGAGPVETARTRVREHLAELHRWRDRLGGLLLVDPHADAAAWQQYGALLAAVDRLRVEIEAAVRPASAPWRPPQVTQWPRQAVRRMIDAGTQAAAGNRRPLRWRPPDEADPASRARRAAIEAAAAAGAAAVAHAAAEMAADAGVIAAANPEATERAQAAGIRVPGPRPDADEAARAQAPPAEVEPAEATDAEGKGPVEDV